MNNKNRLRDKYKIIRKNIVNKEEKSNIITNNIIDLDIFKKAKVIALYKNNNEEVMTDYFINKCFELGKIVCIPKVLDDYNMEFYEIKKDEKLYLNKYNILEPKNSNIVLKNEIDLMIVPGICFDKNKYRMGYGKGYYDKYLMETNIYKIGICFHDCLICNMPFEKHDVQMDKVITEQEML